MSDIAGCAQVDSLPHTPDAQVWLSQSDAATRLSSEGDAVSRSALVRYLQKHPEIATRAGGAGQAVMVDYAALKAHRASHAARRTLLAPPAATAPASAAPAPAPVDHLSGRARIAKVEKDEHDARRAKVLADEAEGRVIDKAAAVASFRAIAVALLQGFESERRELVRKIRSAASEREAEIAVRRDYEPSLRARVVRELGAIIDNPGDAIAQAAAED